MKKIYVVAVLLLVAMMVLTAAVPKPGPKVVLALWNKMINKEAHISLSGLTNFYTYYLTAHAYDVEAKYPSELINFGKIKKSDYEVRADLYEATVYVCDNPGATGVMNLTRNVRYVFPLCDKDGVMNQGEPTQEKISTSVFFPGYWDPNGRLAESGGGLVSQLGRSIILDGTDPVCSGAVCSSAQYVGDGYSDGTTDGNFDLYLNGAQVAWSLDFYNWDNVGSDVWH